jgi:hypothetical protein
MKWITVQTQWLTVLLALGVGTGQTSAQTRTYTDGKVSFEYSSAWRASPQSGPNDVALEGGGSGRVQIGWRPVNGRCVVAALHQDFTANVKPDIIDWGYTTGPKETIEVGESMTSAYRQYRGTGLLYLTTICRDGLEVEVMAVAEPHDPNVFALRSQVLQTLRFGRPPTLAGAWWAEGWNLNFQANGQVISQGWGSTLCRGTYSMEQGRLRTSGWSCRVPPLPVSCVIRMSYTALVLECPDARHTFKRSEF